MMGKLLVPLVLAVLLPVMALAEAKTLLKCKFPEQRNHGNGGWIPPEVFVIYLPGATTAEVHDAVIYTFNGKHPLTARVAAETDKRLTLAWEVLAHNNGQTARVEYRFNYVKATGLASLTAQPHGYDNMWRDVGTCTRGRA